MARSRSLNKVMLIGNLTRDPQIRSIENGFKIASFGLATNSRWRSSDGQEKERVEFHNIVAWNKLADVCEQVLSVGMLIYVEGEIRSRQIVLPDGTKYYKTEIKMDDMKILDAKKGNRSSDSHRNEEADQAEEASQAETDQGQVESIPEQPLIDAEERTSDEELF